jgi:hypothetical protein
MGDFPQDELDDDPSFHITPSSSALAACSSLNPPLTPSGSQLTFTLSLSDIPVVLFDDAYASNATDGRALTQTPCTNLSVLRNRDSCTSSNGAGIRTPDFNQAQISFHRNSRVESQDVFDSFHASESSNTLASMGTFGPRRINLKLCWDRRLSTGTSFSETTTRHSIKGSAVETLPDTVALLGLTSQASPETLKDIAPGVSLSGDDKTIASPSLRTPDSTWGHRPYKSHKIPETPSKVASDRTASWIHSQSPQTQNYGFPEFVPPVHGASTDGKQALILVTPTRRGILTDDMNLVEVSSPRIRREHQECKPSHQVETFLPKHFRQPEEDFAWIRDMTVQCLVDQEGFRSAQPSFKLSGIVHLRSSPEQHQTPSPATAQFKPITRQSFLFHHAAFETPPILRRVTTNDQETHDYVSKQAHLTLKCNGVYIVHGNEISSVDHDGEAQKLSWQFEYLVDDRRLDVSGRIIEGEKVLTPLTFSCSPELLLPAQGKRVNIMHVFKKSIASKLFAEKLQPPGTPNLNDGPESPNTLSPGKNHGWSLHRRVKSHGTRQQDGHTKTVNSRTGSIHSATNSHRTRSAVESSINGYDFGRHCRASSMGNHSKTASYSSVILRNRLRHDDSPTIKNTVQVPSTMQPLLTRHIIPPSRLAELFDTTEFFQQQPVPASMICEPSAFVSLTPRPRSRHA